MMHVSPPPAVDLLSQAVEFVKPHLDPSLPVTDRLRTLWAAVFAARDFASSDIVEAEFLALARECALHRDLGYHPDEDLRHIIRWALLGRNPFGN